MSGGAMVLRWQRALVTWERSSAGTSRGVGLAAAIAVATEITHCADTNGGSCYPGQRHLATACGVRPATVVALRTRWVAAGWLRDTGRRVFGGSRVYELAFPAGQGGSAGTSPRRPKGDSSGTSPRAKGDSEVVPEVVPERFQAESNLLTSVPPYLRKERSSASQPSLLPCEQEVQATGFDFEAVYQRYPRKQGKAEGMAWLRRHLTEPGDYAALTRACEQLERSWSAAPAEERQYLPHWSTFVRQRRWLEELPEPRQRNGAGGHAAPARAEDFAGGEVPP